jgi:hypothetical protein
MKLYYHFVTVINLNHYLLSEFSQIAQQARRAQRILRDMQEQDRQNTANRAVVIRAAANREDGEQGEEDQAATGENPREQGDNPFEESEEEEEDQEEGEDQFSAEDRNWYANYIAAAAAVRPPPGFFGLDPRPLSPLRFTSGMMILKLSCF